MEWNNLRLLDPVAHDQKWKTAVRPNLATLILALLVIAVVAYAKPVLLLAVIPAFILIGIVWWRLADRMLRKLKADEESAGKT